MITTSARQFEPSLTAIASAQALPESPFAGSKDRWRVYVYARMLVADLLAITVASAVLLIINGEPVAYVMHALFALMMVFYVTLGLKFEVYSIGALKDPVDSARRSAAALISATAIVTAIATLLDATVRPIGLTETVFSAGVLMLIRIRLGRRIGNEGEWTFANELVLVQGPVARDNGRPGVDVLALGIQPGSRDPRTLQRLGELLKHCEKIILDVPTDRRSAWLETLRGIDVEVEMVTPELDIIRPVAIGKMEERATAIVRRASLPLASRVVKRCFDVAVAVTALILLSPLLLVLALLIKRGSLGPILFRQVRVGRGNRHFHVLKFRTMFHGAVDVLGQKSVGRHDERVTPLGRFMRNTSLDELPQLINVIRGDMSIVGPRPHALGSRAGGELFWEADTRYWDRHSIKPGMTGLAQVRGQRGGTSTEAELIDRLESDLEYIRSWSFFGDVSIMLRTLKVITHRNAF